MKLQVIRTYDKGYFEKAVSTAYEVNDVKRVEVTTESEMQGNHTVIWYIAFVFYEDPKSVNNMKIAELHVSNRVKNALRRQGCKTVGDLIDYKDKHSIRSIRNLGPVSIGELECELNRLTE